MVVGAGNFPGAEAGEMGGDELRVEQQEAAEAQAGDEVDEVTWEDVGSLELAVTVKV